MKLLKKEERH